MHHIPDSPYAVDWGYPTGDRLLDASCDAVGQYFGRVVAWYSAGGFTDEYGLFHASPHRLDIPLFEVLNEMEHNTDIGTYSQTSSTGGPPPASPVLCSASASAPLSACCLSLHLRRSGEVDP